MVTTSRLQVKNLVNLGEDCTMKSVQTLKSVDETEDFVPEHMKINFKQYCNLFFDIRNRLHPIT